MSLSYGVRATIISGRLSAPGDAPLGVAFSAEPSLAVEARTGPFLGVQLGWAERSGPAGFRPPFGAVGLPGQGETKSALMAQAVAGYDAVLAGHWLGGLELAVGYGGGDRASLRNGAVAGVSTTKAHYAMSARLGRSMQNGPTPYLRAGFASERVHETYLGPTTRIFPPPPTEATVWKRGPLAGAGLEWALSPHASLRAEYAYRFLKGDYHAQSVLAGLIWRF